VEYDSEISKAFEDVIRKYTVYIKGTSPSNPDLAWSGTGCIFNSLLNPNYEPKAMIVTAGHVLRGPTDDRDEPLIPVGQPKLWQVEREDPNGGAPRIVSFKTPSDNRYGPRYTYYKADPRVDIGVMFADANCVDGRPFVNRGNDGRPCEKVVPVLPKNLCVGPGSRVAWAGFPAVAQAYLGFHQLCYYEGVVSAVIDRKDFPPLYLLDGHNTWGLSGGPVWAYVNGSARCELIGVIVQYLPSKYKNQELPGLVCATPIRPLLMYLEANYHFSGSDGEKSSGQAAFN